MAGREITVGDLLRFQSGDSLIYYRIVTVNPNELLFQGGSAILNDNGEWKIVDVSQEHTVDVINQNKPQRMLDDKKPTVQNATFTYYGKTLDIPNIGDILLVDMWNFGSYYILITQIEFGSGKKGTFFRGIQLGQKGMTSGFAPSSLRSRNDFELKNVRTTFYPKDKKSYIGYKVTDW